MKTYKGKCTENIVFPLGGIGTGSVGLAGNGMLVDPELRGCPNREADFGRTGFAVRAERDGRVVDWRMLFADSEKDLTGTISGKYGLGCCRPMVGFRHFREASFTEAFPFATLDFSDDGFPARASLTAFNPFIPSNEDDSSLPAAFFTVRLKNTARETTRYTVAMTLTNLPGNRGANEYKESDGLKMLTFNGNEKDPAAPGHENLTIATDADSVAHQTHWLRNSWFDALTMYMNDLNTPGAIRDRVYDAPTPVWMVDTGTLTAWADLAPGEEKDFRFYLTWYLPSFCADWEKDKPVLRREYAARFSSSVAVASYCHQNRERLAAQSALFRDALSSSTLPGTLGNALIRNLCILKSTTCLRLEDGSFWGWEGVNRNSGSCMGTCEHVWNYAYALPFLFPRLERGLRTNELHHCLDDSGILHFRMPVTRDAFWWDRPCADGQMGTVIKCCREWKLSGDTDWLRAEWPRIRTALEYAWSPANRFLWDPEKTGVFSGSQHHTLDVELYGVHAWLTGFYHAALLAGEQMALALGETESAAQYRRIFEKGRETLDNTTFNGAYYRQGLALDCPDALKPFCDDPLQNPEWEKELGEIRHQIGDGCEIDQVLAGWHADLVGLGDVFVPEHRKAALASIYRYNFVSMRNLNNPCRVFACNDERGTVITSFPGKKPALPIPYSEECMTGFEYAVAGNMLQCGMEKEALELTEAVDARYDGARRNPFAELECGASYSRAMASYAFLLIRSGFRYDLSRGMIGFRPQQKGQYFWSVDGAWGTVDCREDGVCLRVLYGELALDRFVTDMETVAEVTCGGKPVAFTREGDCLCFSGRVPVRGEDRLQLRSR